MLLFTFFLNAASRTFKIICVVTFMAHIIFLLDRTSMLILLREDPLKRKDNK